MELIFFFAERNIEILDFKEVYSNRDDFFFNQDHVNEAGGADLTQLILERIH